MIAPETILLAFILAAGFYAAWNIGANDVANAMGTSVGSGALTLRQAVCLAAVLEFCGAFFFGSHVSETIQKGIVDPQVFLFNPQYLVYGMLASLLATGAWLQLASWFGLPVSATHTIVGSVVGFGMIIGGIDAVHWDTISMIVASWIISPLAGGVIAYYFFCLLRNKIFYTYNPLEEAKKLTPFLVFIVVCLLSQILIVEVIGKIGILLNDFQALSLGVTLGLLCALISYFLVRKMRVPSVPEKNRPTYGPEITYSLGKARKHLQKVQTASIGELNYHTSVLLDEVDNLTNSLKQNMEKEVPPSEYRSVEQIFGYLQIMSAGLMAFAHGANDVANAIGPLAAAYGTLTTGVIAMQSTVPLWALALGGIGIVIGLATWGWRVIETIGKNLTELTPTRGFVAEFSAAATILVASRMGLPISTTHTLVGAVLGVGLARGIEALNIGMTRDIVISWIVTVPAGAVLAVAFFHGIKFLFG